MWHCIVRRWLEQIEDDGMPVALNTPERNVKTIRFYEKLGFQKVKFFRSDNHFSIQMVYADSIDPELRESAEARYISGAMRNLLRYGDVDRVADSVVVSKWNETFVPYLPEEEAEKKKVISAYRRFGVTPEEYFKYKFSEIPRKQQGLYLTDLKVELTKGILYGKPDKRFEIFEKLKAELACGEKKIDLLPELKDDHIQNTVCLTTCINKERQASVLFGLLEVSIISDAEHAMKCETLYASLNRSNGKISSKLFNKKNTIARKTHPLNKKEYFHKELPQWQQLLEMALDTAGKYPEIPILEWHFRYGESGWKLVDVSLEPLYWAIQSALGRGIKPRIEKALQMELVFETI